MSGIKQVVKAALPAGTRVVRLPAGIGRGLRIGLDLRGGHVGLFLGLYEVELNRHLRRLCYRGARSFDIGGSIGYDALVLAKLSGAKVLSVEADPALCEQIETNAEENGDLPGSVDVVCAYVDKETRPPDRVSIDDLANKHFVPDFMKIDIEGAEADALLGATNVLRERRPNLIVEVHSQPLEDHCFHILEDHGYQPVVLDQRRWLRDHRPTAHNRWLVAAGQSVHGGSR